MGVLVTTSTTSDDLELHWKDVHISEPTMTI